MDGFYILADSTFWSFWTKNLFFFWYWLAYNP